MIQKPEGFEWESGTKVQKKSGSGWVGLIVGFYSTEQAPEGYAIESSYHKNTVQLYPKAALELCSKNV